jgi:hypothetical protein
MKSTTRNSYLKVSTAAKKETSIVIALLNLDTIAHSNISVQQMFSLDAQQEIADTHM